MISKRKALKMGAIYLGHREDYLGDLYEYRGRKFIIDPKEKDFSSYLAACERFATK